TIRKIKMPNEISEFALSNIHCDRNKAKAFRNALGFLRGVIADQRINPIELDALHSYMLECAAQMDEGDIIDVLAETECLAGKAAMDQATEADLLGVIGCILEYQCPEDATHLGKVEEFLGICSGVVADKVVNQKEASHIQHWLSENDEIVSEWPACDIARRLNVFLDDGVLDAAESKELYSAMKCLVGGSYAETGATTVGLPIEIGQHLAPELHFKGRTFCFTGKFFYGKRRECEAIVYDMGGDISNSVTKKTDYLVIGGMASPFWLTSHYGTKIKKVMTTRSDAFPYLVGEDVWRKSLEL
ncbi:MAG: BRCT domain-containing protein, partial [Kordiimonadaceae bacterium]|nr:BRCT domain-containing protein [Kordiimonadaceae bacterium]